MAAESYSNLVISLGQIITYPESFRWHDIQSYKRHLCDLCLHIFPAKFGFGQGSTGTDPRRVIKGVSLLIFKPLHESREGCRLDRLLHDADQMMLSLVLEFVSWEAACHRYCSNNDLEEIVDFVS